MKLRSLVNRILGRSQASESEEAVNWLSVIEDLQGRVSSLETTVNKLERAYYRKRENEGDGSTPSAVVPAFSINGLSPGQQLSDDIIKLLGR